MALVTYVSAGVFDDQLGSTSITGGTNSNISTGVSTSGFTAPNLTNKATGAWIFFATIAAGTPNYTIALQESGVTKASATINFADLKLGFNYVRFSTPYQFATLTASAYTLRITGTVNSGSLRQGNSGVWFQVTYNTARALGATDDVWIGGFNDSGMTTKTWTISGTSNSFGSGQTGVTSSISATQNAALTCGNGGSFVFDTSASTTLTLKGSVFTTTGGLFDMRASSNKARVNTLIIDSATLGEQMLNNGNGNFGGQILMTGATYNVYTTYASGSGTAASPMIVQNGWDADVGDEIIIGGGSDYTKNEVKYIKTRNSATSFVLCDTPGGAESALANTHTVGSHMNNMTRNVVVKPLNTSFGMWMYMASSAATSDFSYTRWEYFDSTSGKAINPLQGSPASIDGMVLWNSSVGNRFSLNMGQSTTTAQTITGVTLYNTRGTNYGGQSGMQFSGTSNKTVNDCFYYNAPGGTVGCAFITIASASTGNVFNNCHSHGANAANSTSGHAIGIFSSTGNTFNNCSINGTRNATSPAVLFSAATAITFNNCNFGVLSPNATDINFVASTLNQAVFNACSFNSTNLIINYLTTLDTSLIAFQDMDGSTSKHRWYTNYGSWWSAGSGLTDTTVRTAGSLSLVSKPENATTGSSWVFKIPANPTSQVGIFGYIYRNATFSSGTLKVELFLPGTLLTGTPDATYTFPTTTGSWLPFNISAYYSGSVARYAQVRITGVTATAGAYFFVDDLYDAGTGNKVAGLDLWDSGQPSQIMVQSDFSVVPSAVWGYSSSNTQSGTMGKKMVDASKAKLLL